MLSILIPTYNHSCSELVQTLYEQSIKTGHAFEIIVADDASMESVKAENRVITKIPHCNYIELEQNIGPARIRNYLADKAQYPYLLFLDADVFPVNPLFIAEYLTYAQPETVVCGGFVYDRNQPFSNNKLRYLYGINVEERSATDRAKKPYANFIGMSFLIPKKTIREVPFDHDMHFGYEDAHFGMQLEHKNMPIMHIDNPVYHLVNETSEQFLIKTQKAVKNLIGREESLKSHVRLLAVYDMINRLGLKKIILLIYGKTENRIRKNLLGNNPSLKLFAFYKLSYLCRLKS